MPAARRRASRRSKRAGVSRLAREQSRIATRIDDLSTNIERIRFQRAPTVAAPRRESGLADTFAKMDLQSMLEKTAAVTGRLERTVSLLGVIGGNVKSLASPVMGMLNPFRGSRFQLPLSFGSQSASGSSSSSASGESAGAQSPQSGEVNELLQAAAPIISQLFSNSGKGGAK